MTKTTTTPTLKDMQYTQKIIGRAIKGSVLANIAFGFAYLVMLNGVSTQGFDLETLKAEHAQLQKQIETSEISLAIPSSIFALERHEQIQTMPEVSERAFLEIRDSEVAFLD